MKSESIIKDLNINYLRDLGTMPRKYYLLNDRIDYTQKILKQKLHKKKDKKKVDDLIDMFMEASSMESNEQFVAGFVFATQLMAEVFSYKVTL